MARMSFREWISDKPRLEKFYADVVRWESPNAIGIVVRQTIDAGFAQGLDLADVAMLLAETLAECARWIGQQEAERRARERLVEIRDDGSAVYQRVESGAFAPFTKADLERLEAAKKGT